MLKRTKPMKRVNAARKRKAFIEDFGGKEYLEVIHSMPCAVCDAPCEWTEAAHLTSRGAGGKADVIVPLCGSRFGELGCHAKYDLRDSELRDHEPRLRRLAKRLWSAWLERVEGAA